MELFLWFWHWDARLMYRLSHPHNNFVLANLWIIPLLFGIALIVVQAVMDQYPKDIGTECLSQWSNTVNKSREIYNVALFIQQILLFMCVLKANRQAHLNKVKYIIIKTPLQTPQHHQINVHAKQKRHNTFWYRTNVTCSIPGLSLLLVSLVIYFWTWKYLLDYDAFLMACTITKKQQVKTSGYWVMIYSWVILVTGTPSLLAFIAALAIKLAGVLSYVICPLKFLAF